MQRLETFSPTALQPFVSYLVKRGIPAERYLQQHHIPIELLGSEDGKIFKRQAYGFFRDAAENEGLPTFGLLDGAPNSIRDLGVLGQATLQAETLRDGLLTFAELLTMVAEGNHVWLEQGPELSWIYCRTYDLRRTDYVPDHTSILALREVVRLAAGPDWQPPVVSFYTQPVADIAKLEDFATTEVNFLQPVTGLSVPTPLLAMPLQPAGIVTVPAEGSIQMQPPPDSIHEKIYTVVLNLYGHRCHVSVDQVAEILGINRLTLYRSLREEGTNYRQIVDRVRYKLAVDLLENSTEPIHDIARVLGYSTTGNFTRAFQRMSGLSPTKYRQSDRIQ